jgi:hypothetical protein
MVTLDQVQIKPFQIYLITREVFHEHPYDIYTI